MQMLKDSIQIQQLIGSKNMQQQKAKLDEQQET